MASNNSKDLSRNPVMFWARHLKLSCLQVLSSCYFSVEQPLYGIQQPKFLHIEIRLYLSGCAWCYHVSCLTKQFSRTQKTGWLLALHAEVWDYPIFETCLWDSCFYFILFLLNHWSSRIFRLISISYLLKIEVFRKGVDHEVPHEGIT